MQDETYTTGELHEICTKMRRVSDAFYVGAVSTGNHPFIEFCGLMNEYIKVCQDAAEKRIPFPLLTEHTGEALPVQPHHMLYIAEKLRCIFGPIIDSNQQCREILKDALFPPVEEALSPVFP